MIACLDLIFGKRLDTTLMPFGHDIQFIKLPTGNQQERIHEDLP